MRKLIICLSLFLIFPNSFVCAQNIILTETEKIATTAKLWGFLKYYHPNVANGTYNWDNQLFYILAQVHKINSKEEYSKIIEDWLIRLGDVRACKSCDKKTKNEYFEKNLNLEWLSNEKYFSKTIIEKLHHIKKNRYQGKQYYISWNEKDECIIPTNEIEYNNLDWLKEHIRLGALIRYWNIVEYFFPYKYQMDQNWDKTLLEMIPKFSKVESELDFHLAMLETVALIDDSHGFLTFTEPMIIFFGYNWIPADFKIIENQAVITRLINESFAEIDDIRIGDAIIKIDGKTIPEIIKEKDKYRIGSNRNVKNLKRLSPFFFNGNSDSVTVEFIRNSEVIVKTINRYPYRQFNSKLKIKPYKYKIIENNIGYADLGQLEIKDVKKMMLEFDNTKAIIFDVRNYPKDVLFELSNYLNTNKKDFVRFMKPDFSHPGRFVWLPKVSCGKKNKNHYKGKVVILVNHETLSHAEFTVMALKTAENSIVIGDQTAGADGNICEFYFWKNIKTRMTSLGTFYPNGEETQRVGIIPDIIVKQTIKGIKEERDEILERAILHIETNN